MSDITFSGANQPLVAFRGHLIKKDTEFDSKVSYSFETVKWNQKESLLFESVKNVSFCKNWQKYPIQFSISRNS